MPQAPTYRGGPPASPGSAGGTTFVPASEADPGTSTPPMDTYVLPPDELKEKWENVREELANDLSTGAVNPRAGEYDALYGHRGTLYDAYGNILTDQDGNIFYGTGGVPNYDESGNYIGMMTDAGSFSDLKHNFQYVDPKKYQLSAANKIFDKDGLYDGQAEAIKYQMSVADKVLPGGMNTALAARAYGRALQGGQQALNNAVKNFENDAARVKSNYEKDYQIKQDNNINQMDWWNNQFIHDEELQNIENLKRRNDIDYEIGYANAYSNSGGIPVYRGGR